ncbi:ADP-ribose 1''-phosphate phosphatase [Alternaria panax]|uniref:ADP-ribose 1''-phosphate phosphatase n=1 Tax=Alternaria panax TaxID=48097 RepID=A0AAD4II83_9PLEO|nr:ADP-ribose 1''-phosphate phosphatase [Alternaria panax]
MPPKDSSITSYFASREGFMTATKSEQAVKNTIGKPPMAVSSEPKDKGKGKRTLSGASTPVPEKRQDTKPSDITTTPRHFSHKDLSSDQFPPSPLLSEIPQTTLNITYHTGNIFAAPPHSLLVHACNAQGVWGSGIAKAFKDAYPKAYTIYHAFCTKEHLLKSRPVPTGTALLIPPVDAGNQHWIGCLFTSAKYGKGKDKPDIIIRNTKPAVEMLLELVQMADDIERVRMCKINSGKFGVEWKRTRGVLEEIVVKEGWMGSVEVWDPETN